MTSHLSSRFPNRNSILQSSTMQSPIILGLRAAQLLFAFIVLGLSAYGSSTSLPTCHTPSLGGEEGAT